MRRLRALAADVASDAFDIDETATGIAATRVGRGGGAAGGTGRFLHALSTSAIVNAAYAPTITQPTLRRRPRCA